MKLLQIFLRVRHNRVRNDIPSGTTFWLAKVDLEINGGYRSEQLLETVSLAFVLVFKCIRKTSFCRS